MVKLKNRMKTAVSPLSTLGLLLLLMVLLFIAAYLRLRGLEHSPILGDQSILLNIGMHFVNSKEIPLAANKSSAGIMNPPLIAYLLALPLFVKGTLTAVHLFQGIMGVTAVAILAIYTQRLFGWRVALLSTLLFSVNPWAVYYSRFIWNPNPIPLFSTLLLMSLLAYFAGSRHPIHLTLAFLWLAAITQLHLSGLVLVGVLSIIMLIFWRRRPQDSWLRAIAPIGIGLGLIMLLYWPFILFERAVGFTDLQATISALVGDSVFPSEFVPTEDIGVGEATINAASFLLVQELATGNHVPTDTFGSWRWVATFARFLFIASLLYIVFAPITWRLRHKPQRTNSVYHVSFARSPHHTTLIILAIWIAIPILLYLRHTVYLQNYYFLYIYPAPFLAMALMLDSLFEHISNRDWSVSNIHLRTYIIQAIFIVPILLLCLWQFRIYQTWFQQIEQGNIVPKRQVKYVEEAIVTSQHILSQNDGCDLTILAEGGTVERSSLAIMEPFVYPTPVRYVDTARGYIIPATCTVYMTVGDTPAKPWLAANGRLRSEKVQAGTETWHFYEVGGTTDSTSSIADWQNGLTLVSAEVEGTAISNAELMLNYTWEVRSPPPEGTHYHFFNHFLDESGQLITQDDAPAIDSLYWKSNDRLVTQFYLQLPPELENGRYTLLLGLYTWPDLVRIPLNQSNETTHLVTTIEVQE